MNKKYTLLILYVSCCFVNTKSADSVMQSPIQLLDNIIPENATVERVSPLKPLHQKSSHRSYGGSSYIEQLTHSTLKIMSGSYYVDYYTGQEHWDRMELIKQHLNKNTPLSTKLKDDKTLEQHWRELNTARTSIMEYIITLATTTKYSSETQTPIMTSEAAKIMVSLIVVNRHILPSDSLKIARNALLDYIAGNSKEAKDIFSGNIPHILAATKTPDPDINVGIKTGAISTNNNQNGNSSTGSTVSTPPIDIPNSGKIRRHKLSDSQQTDSSSPTEPGSKLLRQHYAQQKKNQ